MNDQTLSKIFIQSLPSQLSPIHWNIKKISNKKMPRHLCNKAKLMLFIPLNLMMIFNAIAQNQQKIEDNQQGTFQLKNDT